MATVPDSPTADPMADLHPCLWPAGRVGEALSALAHRSGLAPRHDESLAPPVTSSAEDDATLNRWVMAAADHLGIEAEPVEALYTGMEDFLRRAGPALVRLRQGEESCFLALLSGGHRWVALLGPDSTVRRLRIEIVRAALCRQVEAPLLPEIDLLFQEAAVPAPRRARARTVLLRQRLAAAARGGNWLLRLAPGAPLWRHLRRERLLRYLVGFVGAHMIEYLLFPLSWWLIGRGVLQGRLEIDWLVAWGLILLTTIPMRFLQLWWMSMFALGLGSLLKRRLLHGSLRLEPDEIRHLGAGQLLGRVMESDVIEFLFLLGGFLTFFGLIEAFIAGMILAMGAGGVLHALLLLGWVLVTCAIAWGYFRSFRRWTGARLNMTHDLIERMVGHRTRLAQQSPEHWHDGEDGALTECLELVQRVDHRRTLLIALVPRGWMLLGLLALAAAFVSGHASVAGLAIGLGGNLFAFLALENLMGGLEGLAEVGAAWKQISPFLRAAERPRMVGLPAFAGREKHRAETGRPLLEAHNLSYHYHERDRQVLRDCSLQIRVRDRILLEGPSGGGKSTFVALLAGLRLPSTGLLLLEGLDPPTLGAEEWRRRIATAPQFHENYVFNETFLYNVLLGCDWPPPPEDVARAEALCRELGLGDLLDRMPAGLLQIVGETGWQLSQGERNRLYIARALAQKADLVILDESLSALDPENLRRVLRCVLDRAATLLVIGHP